MHRPPSVITYPIMSTPSNDALEELEEPKEENTVMTISPANCRRKREEPNRGTDETAFQFNFFADLLHGVHPGNNGHHRRRYMSEEPNGNDMNSLVEFEKWNELNEDCRMAVVKYLEYNDRCKLGICSKRDYYTVKSTPLDVRGISIENKQTVDFENLTVTVELDYYCCRDNTIQLIFSQLGEDTQVRWYEDYRKEKQYKRWLGEKDARFKLGYYRWAGTFSDADKERLEKRIMVLKSCNYKEEAVKFAEKWMKKCNFELEDIKIEMKNYPMAKSQIKSLPKCEFIRIGADDVETFRWWIQKLPNRIVDFELVRFYNQEVFTIPSNLLNCPQIMGTSEFDFWCCAGFSDEQFLNLKASDFIFRCVNITDKGINQYIKKWVNGNGTPDFKKAVLWTTDDRNFDEMTRELEYREWNEDFENEQPVFCGDFERVCGRGRCVQIYSETNPYESITLKVSSNCVGIYGTGHKKENYEEAEYSI
ncbi:unnamed protein product [Caenorhabditis nigoni]